jgi:demethylmenaquinone methyltransferase / 2-methoxy-6-polyprenyl-1,4-benzoquinol methylase
MSNVEERSEAARSRALVDGYYADPVRRLSFARASFNRSAEYYDRLNRLFSLGSGAWYRRACLRRACLGPRMRMVDIAVGTGLMAREALNLTHDQMEVIGVDISEEMLAVAQRNLDIPLIQAAAEALPLAPSIADFVTMGYALRHVADLEAAFREALRVLRPGGTIVLLEISAPRKRLSRAFATLFIGFILPVLSLLTTRNRHASRLMRYHWHTIMTYMPPEIVMRVMRESGFCNVACVSDFDLFHHYSGQKPQKPQKLA